MRKTKSAYTFIELMVVITIISILSIATYVPYSFYQNKEKLRTWAKEIAQSIVEARNLAINWLSNSNSNVSIGLYFDKNLKNKLEFFSYPFDYVGPLKTTEDTEAWIKLLKTREIPAWISINNVEWHENFYIVYDAISWNAKYFYENNNIFIPYTQTWTININIWFMWRTSGIFSKTVKYDTQTYISDY